MSARPWVLALLSVACSAESAAPAHSNSTAAPSTVGPTGNEDVSISSAEGAKPSDVAPSAGGMSTTPSAGVTSTPDLVESGPTAASSAGAVTSGPDGASASHSRGEDETSDRQSGSDTPEQPVLTGDPTEEAISEVPTARGEHGVGMLDDEVYVLGGFTPTVTNTVQVYTPATDTWRDVADFPVVFHHPNVATVGGKLYVLGFHAGSGQRKADGSSYAYDPTADEWTPVTPMPEEAKRGASCVTTYQGKVYVFGGTNDVALAEASTYDPQTDEWETLPLLPAFRHHCVAAVVGDKIYIVSGRDVIIEEVQAESYIYDPAARTYEEVAPISTPRGGAAGALLGGKIYVFGGEGNEDDPNGIFHETEVYDPATDTWAALPDMTLPRHGFGAAVIGEKIYLPAGSKSRGIDVVDTQTVFYLK